MSNLDAQFAALTQKLHDSVKAVAVDLTMDTTLSITMGVETPDAMSPFGSPVDTGLYQASHTVAINKPNKNVGQGVLDPNTLPDMMDYLSVGDTIIVANALPYADDLEAAPSPLRKTRGGMYKNAAVFAVQSSNSSGKKDVCAMIASKYKPAKKVTIGVNA